MAISEIYKLSIYNNLNMVEAAGVEPASESMSPWDSTCVSASFFSCPV